MENNQLPTGNQTMGPQVKTLADVEKEHILNALEMFKGNKSKTAKALDVSLKTLYNKLHSYGLMGE